MISLEYHWCPSFITVHTIHNSNVVSNIQTLNAASSNCCTTHHFELFQSNGSNNIEDQNLNPGYFEGSEFRR